MTMKALKTYTREKESTGNLCGDLKDTAGNMMSWQSADNLILIWTRKSWYKRKNKVAAKQTWVKTITIQVTSCKLRGKWSHPSRHQKVEDIHWGWDANLAGRVSRRSCGDVHWAFSDPLLRGRHAVWDCYCSYYCYQSWHPEWERGCIVKNLWVRLLEQHLLIRRITLSWKSKIWDNQDSVTLSCIVTLPPTICCLLELLHRDSKSNCNSETQYPGLGPPLGAGGRISGAWPREPLHSGPWKTAPDPLPSHVVLISRMVF